MWFKTCLLVLPALAGCWLPVSTGSAQSGRTLGKGGVRASMYAEAPTPNLLVDEDEEDDVFRDGYPVAQVPVFGIQAAFGVSDYIDIEGTIEGVLWFGLPMFYGGSIGIRGQLIRTKEHALSIAGSFGAVGVGVETENETPATAILTRAAVNYEMRAGLFALRSGLQFTLARVKDYDRQRFNVHAPSLTIAVGYMGERIEIMPYATVSYLDSPRIENPQPILTGGLMFGVRWGKHDPTTKKPAAGPPPGHHGVY